MNKFVNNMTKFLDLFQFGNINLKSQSMFTCETLLSRMIFGKNGTRDKAILFGIYLLL